MKAVVFVDRDGTIIREPADKQVDSLEKLKFVPGIITGLKMLTDAGLSLIMVSNQDGLGTRSYPRRSFDLVQKKVLDLLEGEGVRFEKVFICPHRKEQNCSCRKPKTGLVEKYIRDNPLDVSRSFVLGDRETDVIFAHDLGVNSVRLSANKSPHATYVTRDAFDACTFIARSFRSASMERNTNETRIKARVSLDGNGSFDIRTRIGFFDHMLAQISRHSLIDMTIVAEGDLHVDEHHTVEDVGIVLGTCIQRALGDMKGIGRFGFTAPLDEALAEVAIDLSGRSFLSFRCSFKRESVGNFPTELVEDFFRAFADGLKATIHINCAGRNDHHKIEAIFKSVARALRSAVRLDKKNPLVLPSTKGVL